MIALCGASRTGKSTLAKAFAEASGMKFVPTDAQGTMSRLGVSPKADVPFDVRLAIQKEILNDCNALYERSGIKFITDRSPIDFMAYLLADVHRQNVPYSLCGDIESYMKDCFASANRHFTTIILVQPGIPWVEAEGKAPAHPIYAEHLNALMLGMMAGGHLECDHYQLPRTLLDLKQRVAAVAHAAQKSAGKHQASMSAMHEAGLVLH
jgi:hypothetical protein